MTRASDLARSPLVLPLVDGGLQSASFTAVAGKSYMAPTGGTIVLPAPTGSKQMIKIALYGVGVTTLSGTTNSTTALPGDNTYYLTDSDVTRGWV